MDTADSHNTLRKSVLLAALDLGVEHRTVAMWLFDEHPSSEPEALSSTDLAAGSSMALAIPIPSNVSLQSSLTSYPVPDLLAALLSGQSRPLSPRPAARLSPPQLQSSPPTPPCISTPHCRSPSHHPTLPHQPQRNWSAYQDSRSEPPPFASYSPIPNPALNGSHYPQRPQQIDRDPFGGPPLPSVQARPSTANSASKKGQSRLKKQRPSTRDGYETTTSGLTGDMGQAGISFPDTREYGHYQPDSSHPRNRATSETHTNVLVRRVYPLPAPSTYGTAPLPPPKASARLPTSSTTLQPRGPNAAVGDTFASTTNTKKNKLFRWGYKRFASQPELVASPPPSTKGEFPPQLQMLPPLPALQITLSGMSPPTQGVPPPSREYKDLPVIDIAPPRRDPGGGEVGSSSKRHAEKDRTGSPPGSGMKEGSVRGPPTTTSESAIKAAQRNAAKVQSTSGVNHGNTPERDHPTLSGATSGLPSQAELEAGKKYLASRPPPYVAEKPSYISGPSQSQSSSKTPESSATSLPEVKPPAPQVIASFVPSSKASTNTQESPPVSRSQPVAHHRERDGSWAISGSQDFAIPTILTHPSSTDKPPSSQVLSSTSPYSKSISELPYLEDRSETPTPVTEGRATVKVAGESQPGSSKVPPIPIPPRNPNRMANAASIIKPRFASNEDPNHPMSSYAPSLRPAPLRDYNLPPPSPPPTAPLPARPVQVGGAAPHRVVSSSSLSSARSTMTRPILPQGWQRLQLLPSPTKPSMQLKTPASPRPKTAPDRVDAKESKNRDPSTGPSDVRRPVTQGRVQGAQAEGGTVSSSQPYQRFTSKSSQHLPLSRGTKRESSFEPSHRRMDSGGTARSDDDELRRLRVMTDEIDDTLHAPILIGVSDKPLPASEERSPEVSREEVEEESSEEEDKEADISKLGSTSFLDFAREESAPTSPTDVDGEGDLVIRGTAEFSAFPLQRPVSPSFSGLLMRPGDQGDNPRSPQSGPRSRWLVNQMQ